MLGLSKKGGSMIDEHARNTEAVRFHGCVLTPALGAHDDVRHAVADISRRLGFALTPQECCDPTVG